MLKTTTSTVSRSGKDQLKWKRTPRTGSQNPGITRSYGCNGVFGHGESGEASSM